MSRTRSTVLGTIGVVGEILITLGVLLFAFLVWQLWWTDVVANRAQAEIVAELPFEPLPSATDEAAAGPVIATPRHDEPPVMAEPPHATTFATIQVPRWTGEPERPISQGTDKATVLDVLGVGHYDGTAMPGGIGNFAIAGHRTTYAKPFNRIAELQVGDPLVIRTTDDIWYVYRVTSTEIVAPTDVEVIAPVPNDPGATPTERMITMTTCNPMYSARQRYIVHGVLDYWAPASDGIPTETSFRKTAATHHDGSLLMYGWLWRHLPGPWAVRVLILSVAALAVLAICFTWVFPALAPHMPFNDTTVGE